MASTPTVGRSFRVSGGSKSDTAVTQGNQILGMFQKGIDYTWPAEDKELKGRLLPARNADLLPEDKAYAGSVVAYRDLSSGDLDADTSTPAFTGWYTNILCYRFFGRTQESFISPATIREALGEGADPMDVADPVEDCARLAKRSGNPDWEKLIEKPDTKKGRATLPYPGKSSLFNMYLPNKKGEWRNTIVITSRQALLDLKRQLAWPTPRDIDPVDPKWQNYLFGDITDPQNGLVVRLRKKQLEQISVNGFVISDREYTLNGVERKPIKDPKILLGRYDLMSSDTLKLYPYVDLVKFLVEDGTVPYNLIVEACSARCDVPPPPKRGTHVSSPAQPKLVGQPDDGDFIPGVEGDPSLKKASSSQIAEMPEGPVEDEMPAPPEDDSEAMPPPPPDDEPETEYYASVKKVVGKYKESEIRALLKDHPTLKLLSADKTSGWKLAAEFGITLEPSKATAAEPTPAAPEEPSEPVAADKPSISATDKARYDALLARATGTAKDEPQLSPEEMKELVELGNKIQAAS